MVRRHVKNTCSPLSPPYKDRSLGRNSREQVTIHHICSPLVHYTAYIFPLQLFLAGHCHVYAKSRSLFLQVYKYEDDRSITTMTYNLSFFLSSRCEVALLGKEMFSVVFQDSGRHKKRFLPFVTASTANTFSPKV